MKNPKKNIKSTSNDQKSGVNANRIANSSRKKPNSTQLQRIYEVVLRDYRRVVESPNPYDVLRVSPNDSLSLIRKRYEQFERFYRPDNFLRLGDDKLYRLAIEIRQALSRAMVEVETNDPSHPNHHSKNLTNPLPNKNTHPQSLAQNKAPENPLAQIFFNDALTYLRMNDFNEASLHFQRTASMIPSQAPAHAYLIWIDFLKEPRSSKTLFKAKEELNKLLQIFPEEDTIFHFLAHLFREDGDLERALAFYKKAAELNPNNRSARLYFQRLSER